MAAVGKRVHEPYDPFSTILRNRLCLLGADVASIHRAAEKTSLAALPPVRQYRARKKLEAEHASALLRRAYKAARSARFEWGELAGG